MSDHLEPGHKCPTCDRKVPYPKKETSTTSRTVAYRVPVDEHEAHLQVIEAASKHLCTFERPFAMFQTFTLALALVLQDESVKGFANRRPT